MRIAKQAAVAEVPGLDLIISGNYDEGWDKFIEHYVPVVKRMVSQAGIMEILADNSSPEDVAYEILAKFYHHKSDSMKNEFSAYGQVVAYLRQMVNNHKTDLLRHKNAQKRAAASEQPLEDEEGQATFTEDELITDYASSRSSLPDSLVQFKEILDTLCLSIRCLPERARLILTMLSEGSNPTEIARALGLGEKSMTTRINRARAGFASLLQQQCPAFYQEIF